MNRKPIFDAARRLLRRAITQREVEALDAAIDTAFLPDPVPAAARAIGPPGVALIQKWEGCAKRRADGRFEAYPDPGTGADPWTIGWGSTGPDIKPGLIWTQTQCDARFLKDLDRFVRGVARAIGDAPTTQSQFDAMVSFHYNTGAIAKATLTKKHVAGDHAGAAAEFGKWVNAGGHKLAGLVKRRAEEAALYARDQ